MNLPFIYLILIVATLFIVYITMRLFSYARPKIYLWHTNKKMKKIVANMVKERKLLREDCNVFLRDFFGIDARSKFIPPDFKNSAEVKVAVIDKFEPRMKKLNVQYKDMFA